MSSFVSDATISLSILRTSGVARSGQIPGAGTQSPGAGTGAMESSPVLRQAEAQISSSLLELKPGSVPPGETNDPEQREATLTDAQKEAGWTKWGSPGVRGWEKFEDIDDPEIRARFASTHAFIEQRKAEWAETPGIYNWDDNVREAAKELYTGFDDYVRGPENARHSRTADIPSMVSDAKARLGNSVEIEGELAVRKDDGTYGWGTFAIRDGESGDLYLTHEGDGQLRYYDMGEVFQTLDLGSF